MTRHLPTPFLLGAAALCAAGLTACARPESAPRAAVAPPGPAQAMPTRPAPGGPQPGFSHVQPAPAAGAAQSDPAALAAACRAQADRIIAQRDRGQLLREDERAARIGADAGLDSVYGGLRATTDRLGRQFARDQIAEECIQENRQAVPRR